MSKTTNALRQTQLVKPKWTVKEDTSSDYADYSFQLSFGGTQAVVAVKDQKTADELALFLNGRDVVCLDWLDQVPPPLKGKNECPSPQLANPRLVNPKLMLRKTKS